MTAASIRPARATQHHDDHASHDGHAHHDHHGLHDRDIASFCFIREQPIAREALRLLLDALQQNFGPNLLRVKGLVHVAEEPDRPAVIQARSTSCTICRGSNAGRTRIAAASSFSSPRGSTAPKSRT